MKCDEDRPACRRCVSTGRTCDGYGIWGGGGNSYAQRQRVCLSKDGHIAPYSTTRLWTVSASVEEMRHFDWFQHRTLKKIPGLFVLSFWDTLLLQASPTEPAVMHALLTLSSVHKRMQICSTSSGQDDGILDHQEQFMLQQYVRTIGCLQPHFVSRDRSSIRVALIACVLFICLECLRGQFNTAQTHLLHGLKVLGHTQTSSGTVSDEIILQTSREEVDSWILEAFSRLQLQLALYNQRCSSPVIIPRPEIQSSITEFCSRKAAWTQLELILKETQHLNERSRNYQVIERHSGETYDVLLTHQKQNQAQLRHWLILFERYNDSGPCDEYSEFAYWMLRTYHVMATIMAGVCLKPDDEMIFDSFISEFVSLVDCAGRNWKSSRLVRDTLFLEKSSSELARSVVDMGWIPPLYYAALKCRNHRVRLQAIRLIEGSSHREGFWDSRIAACLARRVMTIEERDFYGTLDTADDFISTSTPELQASSMPTLPQSYRVYEVDQILPNGPLGRIQLSYKQQQSAEEWRVITEEYYPMSRQWKTYQSIDTTDGNPK